MITPMLGEIAGSLSVGLCGLGSAIGVGLVGIVPRHSHVAERAERSPTIGRQIEPIERRLRGKILGRVFTQLRTTWAPRAPAAFIKVMNYRPAVFTPGEATPRA